MYEKSSAKLGEVKGHRGEERTGGGAKYGVGVVRRWRERPTTHLLPAQSDGSPDAECNADSVESLAGSTSTPAKNHQMAVVTGGVTSRVGDVPGDSGTTRPRS